MTELQSKDKKALLELMLTSRLGDLREQSLIRQGKGWFHVSAMGHEALAAVGRLLREGDFFAGYYRDRPIALARGVSNREMALSFLAKRDGASGGRQMPAHYSDPALGIFSIASVVSASLLPACGLAWGIQLDQKANLVVTTVGDAGTRQGDFFESISFARELNLPMLFLVEDNGIGISTPTEATHPLAMEVLDGCHWDRVDACCVEEVHRKVGAAMDSIVKGGGPRFLWCRTERLSSHSSADDHRKYRSANELEALATKDPIERLKASMIESGEITDEEYDALRARVEADVRTAYDEALEAADPNGDDALQNIWAHNSPTPELPLKWSGNRRMVDAINETFHAAVEQSEDFVFFGQDIADPKGGVFSLTSGLSTKAPDRVRNSPLAESTITGVAVGLAAYGKRPVFEIQFADYIWPGFNQIASHLSTLHWRSNGAWKAPAVIYAPCGGYLPGGALWHSQCNESALAHFPGIQIAIPSTAEDAAGLFWTAMHDDNPTIILIPKHLMWQAREVSENVAAVPFGAARMVQRGDAITVVTWGNGVEVVEESLALIDESIAVEIIDIRSITPLDTATILDSVRKTGRLIVVQEDAESCSVGQKIISKVVAGDCFRRLHAPPVLVAKPDVNIGFNPALEYAVLPSKEKVAGAILQAVQQTRRTTDDEFFAIPVEHQRGSTEETTMPSQDIPESAQPTDDTAENIFDIRVPILGEGITSAKVISLLFSEGDTIEPDDAICEVETDKAMFPIESPHSGELLEWLVAEGDDVDVSQVIARIRGEGVAPAATGAAPALAPEHRPAAKSPRPTEGGLPPHILSQIRNVAPAHMTVKVGWQAIRGARAEARQSLGESAPTPTTMVAWSMVRAMERCPIFTCTVSPHETLHRHEIFDLGIAVALPDDALETAVIHKANQIGWVAFCDRSREAVHSVRQGRVSSKVKTPIILTSMGAYGVRDALPVVVPPAIATLFLGEAHLDTLPGRDPEEKVSLCLSFDHRWMNGVAAAQFLSELRREMEGFKLSDHLVS